jgi:hypothetical protein
MDFALNVLGWGLIVTAMIAELGAVWSLWRILQTSLDFPVSLERLERYAVHACGFVLLGILAHEYLLRFVGRFIK